MKTGDILLFKGSGVFSALIMALPSAEYSHVGIFIDHPIHGKLVFESTSLGTLPDVVTGDLVCGVQITDADNRIADYDGEVFLRPIKGELTQDQMRSIFEFIEKWHGTPYEEDNRQLYNAQVDIFPWNKNKPDASTLFCSETVIMCLRDAKIIIDDGISPNEFTPTDCSDGSIVLINGLEFGDIELITP